MGRQQYLERLALGRSAFEDAEPAQVISEQELLNNLGANEQPNDSPYVQQYNDKGASVT